MRKRWISYSVWTQKDRRSWEPFPWQISCSNLPFKVCLASRHTSAAQGWPRPLHWLCPPYVSHPAESAAAMKEMELEIVFAKRISRLKRKLWCLDFLKICFPNRNEHLWANFALKKIPFHRQSTSIWLQLDANTKRTHFARIPQRENRIFKGQKIKLFISSL